MQPDNEPKSDGWSFHVEDTQQGVAAPPPNPASANVQPVTWTGSEFLDQQKTASWYLSLLVFIAAVSAIVYFISKDFISVGFIVVMGVLFAIIAGRKPRQLQYAIDSHGIQVGRKSYTFNEFKSFSIMRDGAIGYISFLPLKRLHGELSIYYPPEEEQKIFDILSKFIPHEDRKETVVDKFTRMIRF